MAVSAFDKLFTISKLDLFTTATVAAVAIEQVTDWNMDLGTEVVAHMVDGSADPTDVFIESQVPRFTWTTSQIAHILKPATGGCAIGIDGQLLDDASTATGLTIMAQRMQAYGARELTTSTSKNFKIVCTDGYILPRTITASNTPPAGITCEAIMVGVGANHDISPLIISSDATGVGTTAFVTTAGVATESFVCGPVKIDTAAGAAFTLTDVQEINIDFGITETIKMANGTVYAAYVGIQSRNPTIRITTHELIHLDPSVGGTEGLELGGIGGAGLSGPGVGAALDGASTVYLRKVAANGTRVPDATTTHISFVINQGWVQIKEVGGSIGGEITTEITITPTNDGTNNIMVIDPDVAIV